MLRSFRNKHNLTQKQLSDLIKVSRSALSYWELKTRKPKFVDKVKIFLFFLKYYLGIIKLDI